MADIWPPIRLTLDERLHVALADRPEFGRGGTGIHILEPSMILELKYRAAVPVVFKELVEEFGLQPQTASKYRLGLAALDPHAVGSAGQPSAVAEPAIDGPPCA